MKQFLFAAAFVLVVDLCQQGPCWAQSMEDVIYFKNGSVLHGLIMEEDPAVWIKVKTADDSLHTYSMDEVTKILKSEVSPTVPSADAAVPATPGSGEPSVGQSPGMAFLLSFLVPGLGCYVNGGNDTKVGVISDCLYVGGLVLAVTTGYANTYTNYGYGYSVPTTTTTPFLWVGVGAAFGGWLLGMIDAPSYAASHQPHPNTYGDLFQIKGPGYELGLGLSPGGGPLGTTGFSAIPSPSLAFRF